MKRVMALAAAVGMIAIAFLVRGWLDDRDDDGGGGNAGDDPMVLVCVTELADVCEALAADEPSLTVRVEDVAATEAELSAADFDARDAGVDGWLTFAPFPDMVDEERARAGLSPALGERVGPLARSPLVVVGWNDRLDALGTTCPAGEVTWRCVGDVAGDPWSGVGGQEAWGAVKPAHPVPDRTATGLSSLAQAAGSWFGRTDYASNDFADPAFRAWFEKLERGVPTFPTPPRTPLDEMLSKGPAAFDLTGTTESAAGPAVARSRDRDRLRIIYPSPLSTADVVLAPVVGADREDRVQELLESDEAADALSAAGWRVEGRTPVEGVPTEPALPDGNGLPRAGVLQALRSLWVEVVR